MPFSLNKFGYYREYITIKKKIIYLLHFTCYNMVRGYDSSSIHILCAYLQEKADKIRKRGIIIYGVGNHSRSNSSTASNRYTDNSMDDFKRDLKSGVQHSVCAFGYRRNIFAD